MQNQIEVIDNISRILSLNSRLGKILKTAGQPVGNTIERPITMEYAIPPSLLQALIDNLTPNIPEDVIEREAEETKELLKAVYTICSNEFYENIHSRRAVVLHKGCMTYQHFVVRHGGLSASVHMRSGDLRKFLADFQYILKAIKHVIDHCLPEEHKKIAYVNLRLTVDCFHRYTEAVPL